MLNILFIGDAVGKGGRAVISKLLPGLREELKLDAVFLNAENIAHGNGITPETIAEMEEAGVDFCTSGNHIYDNVRGVEYLERGGKVLRPANFPETDPGTGVAELTFGDHKVLLVNLIGEVFMRQPADSPFEVIDNLFKQYPPKNYSAVLIDLHAEATSEKQALAFYVDGRASILVGTHTHTPTADLRTLPDGTGLVCDLGFAGMRDTVLGFNKDDAIERFLTGEKVKLNPIEKGVGVINSVLITIDPKTRMPVTLQRIDREIEV